MNISMPIECPKCGYTLQYDKLLGALTCFCGLQYYTNVFKVTILHCEKCGREIQVKDGKHHKHCTPCRSKIYMATKKKNRENALALSTG